MKSSRLSHLFIALSVGLLITSLADAATMVPITACTDCHGTNPQTNQPPIEGTVRNNPPRAIIGSHAYHINSQALTCAGCHVVPTTLNHRDGKIQMSSPMAGGVTYSAAVGGVVTQDNQLTTTGMGTCTGTSCHSSGSPVFGTISNCRTCHGYPPVTTAADPDNKHLAGATPVNHIGAGATVNTKATFVSQHGGCQICHGTQSTTDGNGTLHDPHTNYTVTTQHGTGSLNMNGPTTAPTTTSTRYDATIRGCLNACHGSAAPYRMTASAKTLAYGAYGAGGDCISCHTTAQGTRSAVVGEFGLAWGHKKLGRAAVTVADCIVCHLEGDFATQSPSAKHKNGNIDLRDPDVQGETAITDLNNAAWTFTKFSISYAAGSRSATAANDIPNILTRKFCLKCHDADGAANTYARTSVGSQYMPWGGTRADAANYTVANGAAAAGGVVNVNAQFTTTNSSIHPVLGPRNKDYPTPARLVAPYNGFTRTAGTKSNGVIMNCFDCHNVVGTPLTTRTVTAHGNAVTIRGTSVLAAGATPSATNQITLCKVCHSGYDTSTTPTHGTGSASGNLDRSEKTPYMRWGCTRCHGSAYLTAVVRPKRAMDVHGFNTSWTTPAIRQTAFIRNTDTMRSHQPRMIGTTTYTAQCVGMFGDAICDETSPGRTESYTPGGAY